MAIEQELKDRILSEINAASETADEQLIAFANELAAGVTGDREAEIAEALPVPYTIEEAATAQLDGDTIRVPRMVITSATKTPANDGWITDNQGRRMRQPKADCAVGVHTLVDNEYVSSHRFVILWRRDK